MKFWRDIVFVLVSAAILWVVNEARIEIATLSTNQENLVKRVGRIADALPSIAVNVAYERVFKPLKTAVVVTEPYTEAGVWKTNIHLIDVSKNIMSKYQYVIGKSQDERWKWTFVGSFKSLDKLSVDFADMKTYAVKAKSPERMPDHVVKDVSYLLSASAADVGSSLTLLGATYVTQAATPDMVRWPDLAKAVALNKVDVR